MTFIKGPDFPTAGIINGALEIATAYRTGRGRLSIRARTNFEDMDGKGRQAIIVTELPYQVNKARLLERIADLVRAKEIDGISELRDESDKDGMRVVIELKRGEVAEIVLNNLYAQTPMETVFGINMVALIDGQPKLLSLREMLDAFLRHRREVVTRRYKRIQDEKKTMPSLVLIDGGLGQLHAAAAALDGLEVINQPLAAIAKREEILYVYGQEKDPIALDHHSPVLHLIQLIRDEAHRFAVTFHRKRRQMRDRSTELREIPGVGETTTRRLLEHFGSLQAVKQADPAALSAVVTRVQAEAISNHFRK